LLNFVYLFHLLLLVFPPRTISVNKSFMSPWNIHHLVFTTSISVKSLKPNWAFPTFWRLNGYCTRRCLPTGPNIWMVHLFYIYAKRTVKEAEWNCQGHTKGRTKEWWDNTFNLSFFIRISWLKTSALLTDLNKLLKYIYEDYNFFIFSISIKTEWIVEYFTRNPYWCLNRSFWQSKNDIIFLYVILSIILKNPGNKLMGR